MFLLSMGTSAIQARKKYKMVNRNMVSTSGNKTSRVIYFAIRTLILNFLNEQKCDILRILTLR